MTRESLITVMELLSVLQLGPITTPDFEQKVAKLLKLKREVEEALNGNADTPNTAE